MAGMTDYFLNRKQKGFVFLDVLITLFIAGTSLILIIGSISFASLFSKKLQDRVLQLIQSENSFTETRKIVFTRQNNQE